MRSPPPVKCPHCDMTGRPSSIATHAKYVHISEAQRRERFFSYVNKKAPRGCWLWTGALDSRGRGALMRSGKSLAAHRVSWEIAHGPIQGGLWVLHKCDIRHCVNPEHLFLGTVQDNNMDKARKGRVHNTILKPDQVREIRSLLETMPTKDIAELFGVSYGVIRSVKDGRTFKHIKESL